MKTNFAFRSIRRTTFLLLCASLTSSPILLRAAATGSDLGAQLLRAQLPTGTAVPKATCQQLIHAVSLAVHAHHSDAPAILSAALTIGVSKGSPQRATRLPCECVNHLLRAAIFAAPGNAAALLEVAVSLVPECAESLEAMVQRLDDKNVVDDKNGPAVAAPADAEAALDDAGIEPGGFGVGFGPGFPGSPGFTGSPPTGAIALPPFVPVPVTSDVNG